MDELWAGKWPCIAFIMAMIFGLIVQAETSETAIAAFGQMGAFAEGGEILP
ncbi:hypothetical protein [Rhizobium sp. LCM 4573]|uniref:hypothetical protein n=1 Tax=Rhizobium sp. LCM 4573 TaxID=1848291 RepID=UPI001FCCE9A8|nr:hypothetical protein [Rhizobium sp. LCM 4573]